MPAKEHRQTVDMTHPIETERLGKRFGEIEAVADLSFYVAPGEIFGLVGPDGAGKTTTLRMLASIMEPTSGDAWVAGCHVVREDELVKERIGYMSQRFGLYTDLTVEENIDFYADIYGVRGSDRRENIERLLSFSNLTPFRRRQAGRLSGGMKQKLGLACALIHAPQVLLLDEPTNGVDPVSRRDFWRILYQLLKSRVTILVSTAYLDEAERCTRVGLMHQGRLISLGTPAEVKAAIGAALFELQSSDSRRTIGQLRKALPQAKAALFGNRIHLAVPNGGTAAMEQVRTALEQADIDASSLRSIEPSLEDVFVSATNGASDD